MKERIIESIVAFIFGLVITVVSAVTNADVAIIVLGAILMAVGIGCFIWALVDKNKAKKATIAAENEANTKIKELELKLVEVENTIIDLELKNENLTRTLEDTEEKLAQAKSQLKAEKKITNTKNTSAPKKPKSKEVK